MVCVFSVLEEMQRSRLVSLELTTFASQEERGKSVLEDGRNEVVVDLFLSTDNCMYAARSGVEREGKYKGIPCVGTPSVIRRVRPMLSGCFLLGSQCSEASLTF